MDEPTKKRCPRCGELKAREEFTSSKTPGHEGQKLKPYCRACYPAYYREHYRANKEKYRTKRMKYEARLYAIILDARNAPCADCARQWAPIVMETDHREGEIKLFNIGDWRRLRCVGEKGLRAEIAKCDILCPTCHRIRTFRRLGLL